MAIRAFLHLPANDLHMFRLMISLPLALHWVRPIMCVKYSKNSGVNLLGHSKPFFILGTVQCWDFTLHVAIKGTSWGSCGFTSPLNEEWWTTPTFCSSGNWLVSYTHVGEGRRGKKNSLGFQCHHIGSRANYAKFMVTIFLLWGSTKIGPRDQFYSS